MGSLLCFEYTFARGKAVIQQPRHQVRYYNVLDLDIADTLVWMPELQVKSGVEKKYVCPC
jgi:hypothetical protein